MDPQMAIPSEDQGWKARIQSRFPTKGQRETQLLNPPLLPCRFVSAGIQMEEPETDTEHRHADTECKFIIFLRESFPSFTRFLSQVCLGLCCTQYGNSRLLIFQEDDLPFRASFVGQRRLLPGWFCGGDPGMMLL